MKAKTQTQLNNTQQSLCHRIKHLVYASVILMLTAFAASTSQAETFPAATTSDLLLAIQKAEVNGEDDVIYLLPYGIYKLTAADNGDNGFPKITTKIRIVGNGAVIERDASAPGFRFFENSGDLTLEHLTLRGGKVQSIALWGGGAIFNYGILSLRNSKFEHNSVDASLPWIGGAIHNVYARLRIENCTFRNNSATAGGALAIEGTPALSSPANQFSEVTIINSSFISNSTQPSASIHAGRGGAIYFRGANKADIVSTTIAYNKAVLGGGISFQWLAREIAPTEPLTVNLPNVTLAYNRATSEGGGVHYEKCLASWCLNPLAPNFGNTIIANNQSPTLAKRNFSTDYAFKTSGHNLTGPGAGAFWKDPDNGINIIDLTDKYVIGSTSDITGLISNDAGGGDYYRPQNNSNSLVIDKGNPSLCPATDQLGLGRVGTCDIGAVEYRSCTAPPSDMTAWWAFDEYYFLEDYATWSFLNHANPNPNGPLQTAGMVGGAATFTNANQALTVSSQNDINLFNSCAVDGGAAFSIDAWVKTSAGGLQVILDKRQFGITGIPRGYHLFIHNGKLGFQLADGVSYANFIAPSPTNLNDGQWHFIAVTIYVRCQRNGSVFEGKMYVDGNEMHQFQPGGGDYSNNAPLRIGGHSSSPALFFNGSLDEIEIFQRTLTAAEIKALYEAGWAGKCGKKAPPSCQPECK